MTIQIVTAPTVDPIDLIEAKLHLRVTFPDDDSLISGWIASATNDAENITHKCIVNTRCKQVMDSFPAYCESYAPYGQPYGRPPNAIYLERGPINQVVSVQYLDSSNTVQTVPASTYTVDYSRDPVCITPVFGQIWPIPQPQMGAVWVNFDAGYATPISVSGNNVTLPVNWAPLTVGAAIRFSNSGGALPVPLQPKTDYYVQSVVSPGVYTLSATLGGGLLALTGAGTGTSYSGQVPEAIRAWIKLRIASMYENREELDQTGMAQSLAYANRLLDAFKTYQF